MRAEPADLLAAAAAGGGPRAVVIGAGIGGLAAAIRMAAAGWRVQVFERQNDAGGRAGVRRDDGHVFDLGPTIVTVPQLFEELWQLAGLRMADDVELVPLDPFYRIRFDDGRWFTYCGDRERMRAEVARFEPADVAGYDRFMAEAERCYRIGFEELGAKPFDTVRDLIGALPALVRMRSWRTMRQLVNRHFRSPHLRVVFSFHPLLIGGNPSSVTSTYSLINQLEQRFGVHWPRGGTGQLVQGLVGLARRLGVELHFASTVQRITVDGGRASGIELQDGRRFDADAVVSNGDAAWTYRRLVPVAQRRVWTDAKLSRARYSMSLFVWTFGTDRRYDAVPHHSLVLGPRYEGLLRDIFHRHHLAEDFSLYLHRPTATDLSMAPAGRDTFYALAPVPHLDSGTDWGTIAEAYRQKIERRLMSTVLPELSRHLTVSHVYTPLYFRDRLLSEKGAAFGLEPLLVQSAWFRPHNRSEDLPGLYLVGAGTHPGAGMPGVLMSAKALMQVLPPVTEAMEHRA